MSAAYLSLPKKHETLVPDERETLITTFNKKEVGPGGRGFHVPTLHALKCGYLESSIIFYEITNRCNYMQSILFHC